MRVRELLSHGASAAAKLPKWFLKARKPPQSQISRRPLSTAPQPPPPPSPPPGSPAAGSGPLQLLQPRDGPELEASLRLTLTEQQLKPRGKLPVQMELPLGCGIILHPPKWTRRSRSQEELPPPKHGSETLGNKWS